MEVKLQVPQAGASGHLTGTLRVLGRDAGTGMPSRAETAGRPVALFVHGARAHKDSLFFKPLAQALPMDSFRYDLRGEGESSGEWRLGDMDECIADICEVVEMLQARFDYRVDLVVGHSKGSILLTAYLATHCVRGARRYHDPPRFAALFSGRFDPTRAHEFDHLYTGFAEHGYHEMEYRLLGRTRTVRLYREDNARFAAFPLPSLVPQVSVGTQVLLCHGTDDRVVPVADVALLASTLMAQPGRLPGSVCMRLFEGADHNYAGASRQAAVETALHWLAGRQAALSPRSLPVVLPGGAARGAFVVVEGLDRAGKSTQVARLARALDATVVKFPDRSTQIGQLINAYLTRQVELEDHAVHLLFSANRWECLQAVLATLRSGRSVVCDRYAFSGIAYSAAKGLDVGWCTGPDVGVPLPDVTLFLDLSDEAAAQRSAYGEERYEQRSFQRKVRALFRDVAATVRSRGGRWTTVDASGSVDAVWATVRAEVEPVAQRVRAEALPLHACLFDRVEARQDSAVTPSSSL